MSYGSWKPYIPVAQRKAEAKSKMLKLQKQGHDIQPIEIQGRKIATSFWGLGWCDHLESYGDLANRIPRGRTYVRNGSVCHLGIEQGRVTAMVSGSEIYNIMISIAPLAKKKWATVKKNCSGQVGSILELLQGKLSDTVMSIVTDKKSGLFPAPSEIKMKCDCPDYASMCKHIAAVLYGVGTRLDTQPELLFKLRGVDHQDLITSDIKITNKDGDNSRRIADDSLADVFGIEMSGTPKPTTKAKKKTAKKSAKKKVAKKKVTKNKTAKPPANFTAKAIKELRKKFDMTPTEFASLIGVSTPTITNWESKRGKLTLHSNSDKALRQAFPYRKRKAQTLLANI